MLYSYIYVDLPAGIMAKVIYCSKEALYPRFGLAVADKQLAFVRDDLPGCVKRFVICHELYHLSDGAGWWVWREIKANMHGCLRHPVGFLLCLQMSLVPYRIKYYLSRIKDGK